MLRVLAQTDQEQIPARSLVETTGRHFATAICLAMIAFGMVHQDGIIALIGLALSAALLIGGYLLADTLLGGHVMLALEVPRMARQCRR